MEKEHTPKLAEYGDSGGKSVKKISTPFKKINLRQEAEYANKKFISAWPIPYRLLKYSLFEPEVQTFRD